MKLLAIFGVITLLIRLIGCESAVSSKEKYVVADDLVDRDIPALNETEVRLYLRNSTLRHEGDDRIWHIYFGENGRMVGHSEVKESGGIERATGSWQVMPDGQLCREWLSDWGGGTSGCASVFRYDDEYVLVTAGPDGSGGDETRRARLAGNPLAL